MGGILINNGVANISNTPGIITAFDTGSLPSVAPNGTIFISQDEQLIYSYSVDDGGWQLIGKGGSGGSPDLQQVTDIGNSTTQSFYSRPIDGNNGVIASQTDIAEVGLNTFRDTVTPANNYAEMYIVNNSGGLGRLRLHDTAGVAGVFIIPNKGNSTQTLACLNDINQTYFQLGNFLPTYTPILNVTSIGAANVQWFALNSYGASTGSIGVNTKLDIQGTVVFRGTVALDFECSMDLSGFLVNNFAQEFECIGTGLPAGNIVGNPLVISPLIGSKAARFRIKTMVNSANPTYYFSFTFLIV